MSDHRSLAAKVSAPHGALAAVPHAFGGALALAYHAEPRATIDIELNVFVPPERAAEVLEPLEALGVDVRGATRDVERSGQCRVWWSRTPVDLTRVSRPDPKGPSRAAGT